MDMGGRIHVSAALISGKEPTVPIELIGWVGPRAGLAALKKVHIFFPCLLCNPKVHFHVRKSPLVPILSQKNPVDTLTHTLFFQHLF